MNPGGRSFVSQWSGRVGNGMFISQLQSLYFIFNMTLLLPLSDSLVRFECMEKSFPVKEKPFKHGNLFFNTMIPANSLDFFYYKY